MNIQELIENIKDLEGLTILDKTINFDSEMIPKKEVLNIVNQIDEPVKPPEPEPWAPEKPVVPQFVADWYEEHIGRDFEYNLYILYVDYYEQKLEGNLKEWIGNGSKNKSIQTLVNMHQFGYEVKKEKLYTVELPNPNRADVSLVLGLYNDGKVAIFAAFTDSWKYEKQYKLTEAEIKQDFEWAWQFAKEVEE